MLQFLFVLLRGNSGVVQFLEENNLRKLNLFQLMDITKHMTNHNKNTVCSSQVLRPLLRYRQISIVMSFYAPTTSAVSYTPMSSLFRHLSATHTDGYAFGFINKPTTICHYGCCEQNIIQSLKTVVTRGSVVG